MKSKLITVLLSLLAAFSLWLYVITVVSPDSEASFDVYVQIENESSLEAIGLMRNPDQKPVVHLRLSGNRSDLIKLSNENITVKVDAGKIQEYDPNQPVQLNYSISYPGNVPNNAITVVSRNPDYVELDLWQYSEKNVPLEPQYVGTREDGYSISSAEFGLPQVRICGPKEVVDKITAAKVEIDLTGVTQSISKEMEFKLCDAEGNAVADKHIRTKELGDKKLVQVDLVVQREKEIPVVVNVQTGGGITGENYDITYSHTTIRVSGSEENLAKLEKLELDPIDLSQQLEDTQTYERAVELPIGIENVTAVETITVTVTLKGLATKTLAIRDIRPQNTNNLQADIYTEVLNVTFRGPKKLIDALTASSVTAYADFSGLSSGGYSKVPVRFAFVGQFAGLGAVGNYTVSGALGVTRQPYDLGT